MFEIFRIKYFGHQPIAKITNKTLDRIIQREYAKNYKEVKRKLELIHSDTISGKNRLSAAVLKLSDGDLGKIDSYIEICNNDLRDVIAQAEYPRNFELGFEETAANKLRDAYLNDWKEYSSWVKKI